VKRGTITDLFFGVVLSISFFLAVVTLPVLGLAVGLLTPLPIAFYFRKIGRVYGVLMLAIAALIVSAAGGISLAALFLAEFASMGIALSESVRVRLPIGRGVMLTAMASLMGSALLLMAVSSGGGLSETIDTAAGHFRQKMAEGIEAYRKVGLSEEQVEELRGFTGRLETFVLKAFPSLVFAGTISVALLNLLALKGLLKRKGIEEYQADPTVWHSPEPLVWVLISGGFLLLLRQGWADVIGLNLLIMAGVIYFFQGLAIVAFYFKKMETPLFFRVLGYFLILFQQIFTILVIGFGLFDLWFDFRRLKHKEA
jgi:uncharacterized protein YybS (DUF2232 family)